MDAVLENDGVSEREAGICEKVGGKLGSEFGQWAGAAGGWMGGIMSTAYGIQLAESAATRPFPANILVGIPAAIYAGGSLVTLGIFHAGAGCVIGGAAGRHAGSVVGRGIDRAIDYVV